MESQEVIDSFKKSLAHLSSLCRICLTNNDESIPLSEMNGEMSCLQKVTLCTGVTINENQFPNLICPQCLSDLNVADEFRVRCEYSDSLLKKMCLEFRDDMLSAEEPTFIEVEVKVKQECAEEEGDDAWDTRNNCDRTKGKNNIHNSRDSPEENSSDNKYVLENRSVDKNTCSRTIDKDRKYICNHCGKPLVSKYSLKSHIQRMHSDKRKLKHGKVTGYGSNKRYHCEQCDYATPRHQSLKYHVRTHTGEKPYRCDVCGHCFSQPGPLSNHMRNHNDLREFECTDCGKLFNTKPKLKSHRVVHATDLLYPCTICGRGFKRKETLASHTNRHKNIKRFKCPQCDMTFVTRSEVSNHSVAHLTVKNYECNICGFMMKSMKALTEHMKRHNGQLKYKCDYCERCFLTRGELICHIVKHTQEKKFSCPECGDRFSQSTSVNKHMWRKHKIHYRRNDMVDRRVVK